MEEESSSRRWSSTEGMDADLPESIEFPSNGRSNSDSDKEDQLNVDGGGGNLPDEVLKYLTSQAGGDDEEEQQVVQLISARTPGSQPPPPPIVSSAQVDEKEKEKLGSSRKMREGMLRVSKTIVDNNSTTICKCRLPVEDHADISRDGSDTPDPPQLGRQQCAGTRASLPGAFNVETVPLEAAVQAARSLEDHSSLASKEGSEDCSLASCSNDATPAIATAQLVDEGEAEAALKEIDRLKRELEGLKEQQRQRGAEIVLAEPIAKVEGRHLPSSSEERPVFEDVSAELQVKEDPRNTVLPDSVLSEDELFGRDAQSTVLHQVFQRFTDATAPSSQVVLISGESGTGKSALALQTRQLMRQEEDVAAQRGIFISGKFDFQKTMDSPYSAIAQAFEALSDQLLMRQQKDEFAAVVRQSFDRKDIDLLMAIVPSLKKILDEEASLRDGSMNFLEVKHRVQHSFKQFIRLVCSFAPLLWVIDDLQWVDTASLDILQSLLVDDGGANESPRLMLVLCYRDNEVDESHTFAKAAKHWKEQQESFPSITELHVGNLTKKEVSGLLRHMLAFSNDEKEEAKLLALAECVHRKTAGNPFYVKQFILSLRNDSLLTFHPETKSCHYDIRKLRAASNATDNVVALLTRKLRRLSPALQSTLLRIACLGPRFAAATAQIVIDQCYKSEIEEPAAGEDSRKSDSSDILKVFTKEGLLVDCGRGWLTWEHDKVKEAALLLGDNGKNLDEIKFEMGELLLDEIDPEQRSIHDVYAITNLLNSRGATLVEGNPRRADLVALNLLSGKTSFEASAFESAAQYLKHGAALLPQDKWKTNFEQSLEVYSLAAESLYWMGDFGESKNYCDEVISLAFCPLVKKRRLYNVLVHSLAAQGKMPEATDLLVKVLAKLGCKFPKTGRGIFAMSGIARIAMTVDKTIDKLERLSPMADDEKKWALFLLNRLSSYTYQCEPSLAPLAIVRGLDWSLKYGRSELTSLSLSTIGLILAGSVGDFAGGKKYADMALKFMTPSVEANVLFVSYQFVMHYQLPTDDCIKYLTKSYEAGIKSGDLESAFWSAYCVLEARLHTAGNLPKLMEDCKLFSRRTANHSQAMIGWSVQPVWQLAANLANPSSQRHILTGEVMEEAEFKERIQGYAHYRQQLNRIKTSAAFWFDEHELVVKMMEDYEYQKFSIEKATPGTNGIGTLYFHCAMSCVSLAHGDKRKHRKQKLRAKQFLQRIKDWVNKGDINLQQYESLLEAELASLGGKPSIIVAKHYDCAIMLAGRRGLANDHGLAHERFGDHCLRNGDREGATDHYNQAVESYGKWGALAKVHMVHQKGEAVLS